MNNKKNTWFIIFWGISKLLLHFLTNTNYKLHRDEYLYFDEGNHLAWGYFEVPPMTPFIGSLADVLGGSVFAIRLFPALAGVLIIVLACKLVRDLEGEFWAIFVTGFGLLLTPSLLGSNSLFQPVSFNQLNWFLIAYSIIQIIRNPIPKNYYLLGVLIGLAILTKYSVAFYLVAFLGGLLLSKERILLKNRHFAIMLGIAFIISLPNIIWQFNHDFPVVAHMTDLAATQLVHINFIDFLSAQLFAHKGFTILWILGLVGLFSIQKLKEFRSAGFAFLFTIFLIGLLQGKAYYTLGAFLILFPFGGLAVEYFLKSNLKKGILCLIMLLISIPFYPLSFPVLKAEKLKTYCEFLSENYGINYMLRWEDGKYYELPQDIADMHGWEEMVQKVAKIYHDLPTEKQKKCMIYGGSYGHAGSINYFRKKYNLPEAQSLNSSYVFFAKENYDFDNQIMVDDRRQESSQWFGEMILVDSIQNPFAREKGYIYYRSKPKMDVVKEWKNIVVEERGY